MKHKVGFLPHLSDEEQQILLLPSICLAILVGVMVLMEGFNPSVDPANRWIYLVVGTLSLVYILLQFLVFLPLMKKAQWIIWFLVVINGFGTAILPVITPTLQQAVAVTLVVAGVVGTVIILGRWPAYVFLCANVITTYLLAYYRFGEVEFQGGFTLSLVLVSIVIIESILRLGRMVNVQMGRLETINRIAHRMASSIEPDQVISLVNGALKDTLTTDSYYFGLLREGKLFIEVYYQDGEYFPPGEVSVDGNLPGYVIKSKQSLLLNNLPEDCKKMGLSPELGGRSVASLSWMGTPLESSGRILGFVATAAYTQKAFTVSDLELLESVAQQAALVIDNSYRYAEVEEQSHRDSLTHVYNHSYFLLHLDRLAKFSKTASTPLSLIMLDIDSLKQYNETYGHQMGDRVLIEVVKVLRESLRNTDLIGRWGGEEFVVLLPETSGNHTSLIAERIRRNLQKIQLVHLNGEIVPAPMVSQGIALFPYETDDADNLVHLAEKRMYKAKEHGANHIEPDPSIWAH